MSAKTFANNSEYLLFCDVTFSLLFLITDKVDPIAIKAKTKFIINFNVSSKLLPKYELIETKMIKHTSGIFFFIFCLYNLLS